MPSRGPSGEQFEITRGVHRAVVTEVGAGLRRYTVDGIDVVDGYAVEDLCPSGRGQVLAPWPNRLEDGEYTFDGRTNQLPIDEIGGHNAIHGLVRWEAFTLRERDPDRIVLDHELRPRPGYPFPLRLTVEYRLDGGGLRVRTSATNVGPGPCPFGLGAHPYLTLGEPVDALTLHAPAGQVVHADRRGLPTGVAPVDGTDFDFRTPRGIGATVLDHCFTGLARDPQGLARITLESSVTGRATTVWMDEAFGHVMLFTGDPLADVARRALAIEPMTCPPNALRTGAALIRLEPETTFTADWGIQPSS